MTASPSSATLPTFTSLGVPAALADVLARDGITTAFPIQSATLPDSLAGRDVLGRGRTGSGKTVAFALPVVARLSASGARRTPTRPRALVLAPTRELATQIDATVKPLAEALGLRTLTIFGGVGQNPQVKALRNGVDVLVACPGRLEDLMGQGHVNLDAVEVTVLDEADHMADLGFLPGVKRILDKTPSRGQRMLFSATLDNAIDVLVKRYLKDPVTHSVDPGTSAVTTMTHHVLHVADADRFAVVKDLAAAPGRTVVFTRTKHGAKALARKLNAAGVPAVDLHGNLSQNARTRNLTAFSDGTAGTLVATDIAARGIHVDDVGLVVHADPPVEHKAYLHRSGRTARAGSEGTVVTIMTDAQRRDVRDLTRKAGIKPTTTSVTVTHPLLAEIAPGERVYGDPVEPVAQPRPQKQGKPGQGRRRRSGSGSGAGSAGGAQGSRGRGGQGGSAGGRGKQGGPSGQRRRSTSGSGGSHSASSFSSGRR
ncbi:DEAD/DEAH box helicase [Nocardioidaceae bacterium]|nr:DEAD/DEAH box helicase [Nocardioidaceae bacterium]